MGAVWLLVLAVVAFAAVVCGGALVGSGDMVAGVVLLVLGAPTFGACLGRYLSRGRRG